MELSIIRRETTGSPPNQYNESETITKFEIMDGAPVRGTISSELPFVARYMNLFPRRNNSNPAIPGGVRTDTDVPRREQKIQHSLLS